MEEEMKRLCGMQWEDILHWLGGREPCENVKKTFLVQEH